MLSFGLLVLHAGHREKTWAKGSYYHHIFRQTHTQIWLVFPKNASLAESSRNRQKDNYFMTWPGIKNENCAESLSSVNTKYLHTLSPRTAGAHGTSRSRNCMLMDLPKANSLLRNFRTLWCQHRHSVSSSGSDPVSVTNKHLPSNNDLCLWVNAS